MRRTFFALAVATLALTGVSQAAPIAPLPPAVTTDGAQVIPTYYYYHHYYYHRYWRHCWWRHGYRHCW